MKQVFHRVVAALTFTVLSVLSLGVHTAAMQTVDMEHATGGAHLSSCFTTCMTAALQKNDTANKLEKDRDDKPKPPFYTQFQSQTLLALREMHTQSVKLVVDREPPPHGAPAYIDLSVFRA